MRQKSTVVRLEASHRPAQCASCMVPFHLPSLCSSPWAASTMPLRSDSISLKESVTVVAHLVPVWSLHYRNDCFSISASFRRMASALCRID